MSVKRYVARTKKLEDAYIKKIKKIYNEYEEFMEKPHTESEKTRYNKLHKKKLVQVKQKQRDTLDKMRDDFKYTDKELEEKKK